MKENAVLTKTYVGLDVSVLETHICVIDEDGNRICRGAVSTDPDPITEVILQLILPSCLANSKRPTFALITF